MTDRPIIFSGPMVEALLAGRKTMTRRLAMQTRKTHPSNTSYDTYQLPSPWQKGKPGDRLWVREAWGYYGGDEMLYQREPGAVGYQAARYIDPRLRDGRVPGGRWRPSIHMPRWASRLTLIVEAVKVERLQEISDADAIAEGTRAAFGEWFDAGIGQVRSRTVPERTLFASLWDRLHGAGAWGANPEVVAISFKVVKANIDAREAAP